MYTRVPSSHGLITLGLIIDGIDTDIGNLKYCDILII